MRKLVSFIISSILLLAIPINSAYAASVFTIGSTQYTVDGQTVQMDAAPYIEDNRTFLPVRFVANALGISDSNIYYNPTNDNLTLFNGTEYITLVVGSTSMVTAIYGKYGDTTVSMDVAPIIRDGRVYIPISWLAQALGSNVSWDAASQTITLGDTSSSPQTTAYTLPALAFSSDVPVIPNTFTWQYEGQQYSWTIDTPDSLMELEGIYQIPNLQRLQDNYSRIWSLLANDPSQAYADQIQQAINIMIADKASSLYAECVAKELDIAAQQQGYDRFHEAEFITSFVQNVKYTITSYNMEYPPQTLTNGGDCIEKSILLSAILDQLGYQVCVFMYPQASHATMGIAFNDNELPSGRPYSLVYTPYNGLKYYFTETTATGWGIGQWTLTQMGYSPSSIKSFICLVP